MLFGVIEIMFKHPIGGSQCDHHKYLGHHGGWLLCVGKKWAHMWLWSYAREGVFCAEQMKSLHPPLTTEGMLMRRLYHPDRSLFQNVTQ